MSKSLKPLRSLASAELELLLSQAAARRLLLAQALEAAHRAASPLEVTTAFAQLAAHLVELELHDDGARMRALSLAVAADFRRLDEEASELELQAAALSK